MDAGQKQGEVTMKIQITTIQHGDFCHDFVPLVSGPHNVQFDSVNANCLFFHVSKYPRKKVLTWLMNKEKKEIAITDCFIRACIKTDHTVLCYIVRYKVQTGKNFQDEENVRSLYTVKEKEQVFGIQADKKEIVDFVEPFLWRIREANSKKTADILLGFFNDWAHPLTLESVIARLTEEERLKAAKLLNYYFPA